MLKVSQQKKASKFCWPLGPLVKKIASKYDGQPENGR
jgi:hypothetical protein